VGPKIFAALYFEALNSRPLVFSRTDPSARE
jgi:hypothetical protein